MVLGYLPLALAQWENLVWVMKGVSIQDFNDIKHDLYIFIPFKMNSID